MSKFGWSYPPGAANDPSAPYNQEEVADNSDFKEQFADYDSLAALYHAVYKYTDCGPTLGVTCWGTIEVADDVDASPNGSADKEGPFTYYGDDLAKLGTFKEMDDNSILITELMVSSIVEGVDQCTDTYSVEWCPLDEEPKKLHELFWQAVEDCNKDANYIWQQTHGCVDCFEYPEDEMHPIDPECKTCGGNGEII